MSQAVYRDSKREDTIIAAIEAIFLQDIAPYNPAVDGLSFREEHMYNLKVDGLLSKNLGPLQRLFEGFLTPNKRYITLEECTKLMKGAGVRISDLRMNPCYAESMMSRVDTLSDTTTLLQMRFTEFLVFLCRAAHEVYIGTAEEAQPLQVKLDTVLKKVLESVGLQAAHTLKGEGDATEDEDEGDKKSAEGSDVSRGRGSDSDEDK